MDKCEKIVNLFQQDAFKEEASKCESMGDFYNLFIKNGIEITEEETVEIIGRIAECNQKFDGSEISEEDLDNVAGGVIVFLGVTLTTAQAIALGVGSVGAAALGVWNSYNKNRKR